VFTTIIVLSAKRAESWGKRLRGSIAWQQRSVGKEISLNLDALSGYLDKELIENVT